jgi:hypothetical protein
VLGATNPLWIDGDHDGLFRAPALQARILMELHASDPGKLLAALSKSDEAVALQVASLCDDAGIKMNLSEAPDFVRRGFEAVRQVPVP